MRIRSVARFAAVLLTAVAVPAFAAHGTADFTRFVALGDSYGAGLESGSLNEHHQQFSWPAVIARQAGAPDFQQPLVSFPGIGPELQIIDLIHYPPTILPAEGTGQPLNLNLARPYNNLSIPGANVADLTTLTGAQPPTNTQKLFAQFILRGLGTEVQQALAQTPTFIAIWIGGNDALGAVLGGTPAALTPVDAFRTAYNAMLDQLTAGAPTAGIVVGNIPSNVLALPYITTVPPVLIDPATQKPVIGPDGKPVALVADLGGGNIGQLPAGSFVLLPAASKIAQGFGIPGILKAIPPFNQLPHVGEPLADTDVLTPDEVATITQRVNDFNAVIQDAASSRDIPVADIKGLFDRVVAGEQVGPLDINSSFITGGFFSLDGFHLTDIGYTMFADEYIKAINHAYKTSIALAPISDFYVPLGSTGSMGMPVISPEAAQEMLMFAPQTHKRLRAAGH